MANGNTSLSALDGWIEVCRAGSHTDSRGRRVEIGEADIEAIAERYAAGDPAPVVLGHPETDDPAYGWVERLRAVGGALQAKLHKLDDGFRRLVEDGRYRGRSVALDGGPDQWRLRHLGWLGATPPAIAGLAPSEFAGPPPRPAGDDVAVIEFADADASWREAQGWGGIAAIARNLRDLVVDKFSLAEADRALPGWALRGIEGAAAEAQGAPDEHSMSAARAAGDDNDDGGDPCMTDPGSRRAAQADAALGEREAALAAREAAAEAREAEFAARERLAAEREWVDAQVRAGRVLPADASPLASYLALAAPAGGGALIEFSTAAGDTAKRPADVWLKEWIGRLPARVDYSERAPSAEYRPPSERVQTDAQKVDAARFLAARVRALMAADSALSQDDALLLAKAEEVAK